MSTSLKNSVVLVTGANRGIGKSIVEGALAQGASKVYAAVRNPESARELEQNSAGKVKAIRLDLNDPRSIEEAAAAASDVTVVINNAGVAENDNILEAGLAEKLQRQFEVNALGLLRVAQAFAPVLKGNGGGALVQLNSVVSIQSFPTATAYSASKAASYSLTLALREELAKQGTQVVSVHPGPIATDMAKGAGIYEIAEPPSVVADAIFEALRNDTFHVFPDSWAQDLFKAYASFARSLTEQPANA